MRLVFIRHGNADYENDALTEKGKREAVLLAERVKNFSVTVLDCAKHLALGNELIFSSGYFTEVFQR